MIYLASKEMYIGRYYFEKKKWIAAINRFRTVVDELRNYSLCRRSFT